MTAFPTPALGTPSIDALLELAEFERVVPTMHGDCESDLCGACVADFVEPRYRKAIEDRDQLSTKVEALTANLAAASALVCDLAEELGWACDRLGKPLTPDTSSLIEQARARKAAGR